MQRQKKKVIAGHPDPGHISTNYMERQNLNIRMQKRRFTRLTNAFFKKAEMLDYSLTLTIFCHNFVRVHQTIKCTPAMKAKITDHKWSIEELVDLLPEATDPNRRADWGCTKFSWHGLQAHEETRPRWPCHIA